ncbi:hypothetical protein D918_00707 [Trichuris suis]|nr:hypothetical protein D918_00707 [Trichuris suis]
MNLDLIDIMKCSDTLLEMGDDLTLAVVVWSEHYPSLQITSLCLLRHHGLVMTGSSDGRLCLWSKLTLWDCLGRCSLVSKTMDHLAMSMRVHV